MRSRADVEAGQRLVVPPPSGVRPPKPAEVAWMRPSRATDPCAPPGQVPGQDPQEQRQRDDVLAVVLEHARSSPPWPDRR